MGRTVAEPGVAHVDRLAGGARSAPSPAAAPRSPHPLRGLIQRSLDRPSAIGRPAPNARHGIGGSRREPLGRRGAPAAGAGRSAHADARRAPSRPRRGQSTGRTTPISAAISTARAESGARRAPRARVSRERVVNAANFSSDFSSASRERASGADGRRTGRCARRPPSWRRSIGTVTSGRAAVASSSPRPHPAFARSPERHRPPRTECPPWNWRQPARAARSARRTGGWGGSVCSRRCAPRPLAAAARPEHRENNTNFSSNFNSASRVRGSPRPSRARVSRERVVNAANFSSDFSSASRERASGADGRRTGRCARRPPSSRRSAGAGTSGRAASPHHHPPRPASRDRPSAIGSPAPNVRHGIGDNGIGDSRRRRHRRTGGWGGSVWSRRCSPRPSRARA